MNAERAPGNILVILDIEVNELDHVAIVYTGKRRSLAR
jgi:hypothetical protein